VISSKGQTSIPMLISASIYKAYFTRDEIPPKAMMQAKRKCFQPFRHSNPCPYRKRLFSSQAAERGSLAGYCTLKNTAVAGLLRKIPIPIRLLRLNLQLHSLHSHSQFNSHTAKMAELTHPTIKDGKIFQPTRPNGSPWNCSIANTF
jgi:hypothetical protein